MCATGQYRSFLDPIVSTSWADNLLSGKYGSGPDRQDAHVDLFMFARLGDYAGRVGGWKRYADYTAWCNALGETGIDEA